MSVLEVLNRIFIKSDDASSPEELDLKSVQKDLTDPKDKELARKLDIWVVNAEKKHEAELAENIPDKKPTKSASEKVKSKTKSKDRTEQIEKSSKDNKGFEIVD